uniref:Secreted protein n=1 Tax=Panagrellus redivivus TaxID=6233 RepID=A0A7E4V1P6_PANRE
MAAIGCLVALVDGFVDSHQGHASSNSCLVCFLPRALGPPNSIDMQSSTIVVILVDRATAKMARVESESKIEQQPSSWDRHRTGYTFTASFTAFISLTYKRSTNIRFCQGHLEEGVDEGGKAKCQRVIHVFLGCCKMLAE